ncbi:hypothetical protein HXX76_003984 [Chlamydomonas incerta]|uniref:Uncharacterized protein n=1 Tax=Chlamydomonas incerta TaxID=51695 RepID=A0A835W5B4_CHLIN|nr:hypothetical protein HXX76_003984 [Chlamydomonas incerta]|eukprot:KAG2441132.1 hypothetical protein HXX76_003984 [Chlamydomonas incerta]
MPNLSDWLHDMVDRLHAKPANQPLTGKEADQIAQAAFSVELFTSSEASALVADAKAGNLDAKGCIERVMSAVAKHKGCHGSYACGRPLKMVAQGKK